MSIEQSRRDDLESLFYILIYMIRGRLPWQGLVVYDDETRMRKIAECKTGITAEKLTEGLSSKLTQWFKYVKKLKYSETPDYTLLFSLFKEAAEEKGINLDTHTFEWEHSRKNSSPGVKKSSQSANFMSDMAQTEINLKKNIDEMGNLSPTTKPHAHSTQNKGKFKTLDLLGIPATPQNRQGTADYLEVSGTSGDDKGFNSKAVRVDSSSNINSKDEVGMLHDLELKSPKDRPASSSGGGFLEATKPGEKGSKFSVLSTSGMQSNIPTRPKSADQDISENYSQEVMDEQVSNIGKKLEKTTLTSR